MSAARKLSLVPPLICLLVALEGCCSGAHRGAETVPRTPEARVVRALILLRQAAPDFGATLTLRANGAPGVAAFECTKKGETAITACVQRCLAIQSNAEEQHLQCGCASHEGGCSCDCPE